MNRSVLDVQIPRNSLHNAMNFVGFVSKVCIYTLLCLPCETISRKSFVNMKKVFLTLSALVAFVMSAVLKIENADVYVTGSNFRFLSTDIITEFRGWKSRCRLPPVGGKM